LKLTVLRPVEIDADAIRCTLPIRYEEDLADLGSDFPGLRGKTLVLVLDLTRGAVRDWPEGRRASLHLKVVDEGRYELLAGDDVVASLNDYVPHCLPQKYGDYVIAEIAPDGTVAGWRPSHEDIVDSFRLSGA
jgi:hypothetical protein